MRSNTDSAVAEVRPYRRADLWVSSEVERSSLRSRMENEMPIYDGKEEYLTAFLAKDGISCSLYIQLKDMNEQKQE